MECQSIRYNKNKEKIAKYNAEYRERNKEKLKIYREDNKEKRSEQRRRYRERNKDREAENFRLWRKRNPLQDISRRSIQRVLGKKLSPQEKYEDMLGYNQDQLIKRIEFQFKNGMSWDNHGEWHIDHKKPVSRFINQGITDIRIINALSNLQPLWASENRKKSSKF